MASGESIIDALSASYVSAVSQAPILLTSKGSIDIETLEEIKRIGVHEAVIVGGVNVISENVENQLKNQGLTVSKISGSNRYDTAAEIANIASATLGLNQEKVFLCSGKTYADALSIAPVTAKEKGIILLTDGHTLTEETKKFIKSGVRVKIIGGVGVISQDLENKIKSTGAHVERIYGKDRFETSLEVYKKYFNSDGLKTAYLANGITMVDALTGAALAKKDGTGILLARSDKMITAMKEDVIKVLKRLRVLGGTAVIQDNIWIKGYLEDMNPLFGN